MTHRRREERRSGRTRRRWMRRDLSKNCPRNYSDYLQRRRIRNDWMNDSKALPLPLQFNNYLIKALFLYKVYQTREESPPKRQIVINIYSQWLQLIRKTWFRFFIISFVPSFHPLDTNPEKLAVDSQNQIKCWKTSNLSQASLLISLFRTIDP